MKKAVLIILIVALVGFFVLRFGAVTRKVEFSFVHDDTRGFTSLESIKFAMIADIHYREDPREEITGEKETRAILENFIARMNRDVRPDFIVQLGDLNDGCLARCVDIGDEIIIQRLERARAHAEKKTEIPWFNVIGNHEYASGYTTSIEQIPGNKPSASLKVIPGKDFSAIYRAIDEDWSRLEDTWYYRDIKGYRFVFLNTSYPYEGKAHMVPLEQIVWLKNVLESSTQPVFVFMHVPISAGTGTAYDFAVNQEKVSQLLAEYDSFIVGFFGHSHHSDKWDGLRRQLDDAGNVFFHTTAPHQWMGNAGSHPWTIVSIDPKAGRISIEAGAAVYRSELSEFWYYSKERISKTVTRMVDSWR